MLDRGSLKAALGASKDCLPLPQLERAAADPTWKDPHLATCARCQAEVALLRSYEADVALPDDGAAVAWIHSELERRFDEIKDPARARQRLKQEQRKGAASTFSHIFDSRRMRVLVPAAVFAITAAAVILLRPAQEPTLRVPVHSGQAILRSEAIQTLGAAGELKQPPSVLQWTAVAGARHYKVVLMEVDHSPLWTAETGELAVMLPASARSRLLPRKSVLWQVTALDSQGRQIAISQLQRFLVVPDSGVASRP